MNDEIPGDQFIYPRFIPLTKGEVAVVDHWSYDAIMAIAVWRCDLGYAIHGNNGEPNTFMHRVVLELAGHDLGDLEVDHWNGDKSDNRLCNLRPATPQQNQMNKRLLDSNTSGYRGVYWNRTRLTWESSIKLDGRRVYLGCFDSAEEAARARDERAFAVFGHWVKLNFPLKLFYETEGPPRIERPIMPAKTRKRRKRTSAFIG